MRYRELVRPPQSIRCLLSPKRMPNRATTLEQLNTDIATVDLKVSDNLLEDINQIHLDYSNPCP